jgi:hypothetical protein
VAFTLAAEQSVLDNLPADELDQELERRGLRFVRYADDKDSPSLKYPTSRRMASGSPIPDERTESGAYEIKHPSTSSKSGEPLAWGEATGSIRLLMPNPSKR